MYITAVELENIKSHVDSRFEFPTGKISITGENGAGKTSVIEALAWALFDTLEYKKEEFLRRGAKKGSVRVTFESGLDGRQYSVFRDTETSYYVFDPILGAKFANRLDRLADKKEEVARFIRQHFGVEPGTDLRSLFRQAIGVPQGTFTAIFLEGTVERKTAFDKLLKVEEYRQGAEKLRDTARLIENNINDARVQIARIEAEIGRVEAVETELALVSGQKEELGSVLAELQEQISKQTAEIASLDVKEKRSMETRSAADRLASERARAEVLLGHAESELTLSQQASSQVALVQDDAAKHVEVLGRLRELDRERRERDELSREMAKVETAFVKVNAEQRSIGEMLERAVNANREIEGLRPMADEQKALEKEAVVLREQFAHSRSLEEQIGNLNRDLERLREIYRQQTAKKKELEPTIAAAGSLADLERRDAETLRRIASLKAGLERDQKFQAEINSGLCPILSEKCLNLRDGQTLEGFLTSHFKEIRSEIGTLERDKANIDINLRTAREAEKNIALLETTRTRIDELTDEGKRLRLEKDALEQRLEGAVKVESRLAEIDLRLRVLDNPEARIKFLMRESLRENDLRHDLSNIEKNLERLESDRRLLSERLDEFKDLDERWAGLTAVRDATLEPHRSFILHEANAKLLPERSAKFSEIEAKAAILCETSKAAEAEAALAAAEYDADAHRVLKGELLEAERKFAGSQAAFDAAGKREVQLADELKHFAAIRETMKTELAEKERLGKVLEMTGFIRDTLKESAPRVARNYVFLVSVEANKMFSEITGNIDRTLKWNDDYSISLEEDGFERPFVSLSGGEQMAAALAIRLAILKQLSDIRVAFFDEPTTNMDAERRENLAIQLSQIRNFDQLFVISHDDTFESYVDHVISLDRRNER